MDHVLVPVDDSELARSALDHAVEQYPEATIHLLHVVDLVDAGVGAPPGPDVVAYYEKWYDTAEERAVELFDELTSDLDREVETAIEMGPPARTIVNYADEAGIDLIVMGSHGRSGVSRVLLGSVAEAVVRRAGCPVLVVR
ncbi:universal stress protein [Natronomonas sp. EA1]|uniref:universal stress protein n=1 Tax=Natronomonas sp. EA1 TaxID=3421655 RepID=UPI003EBAE71F